MPQNRGVHVVFGAGGGAGHAVVRNLALAGAEVRAVTRSGTGAYPEGVESVRCDAADIDAVRLACKGAVAVHHCINVPYAEWEEKLPTVMANLIEGAGDAGATLVYCDNLYMYRPVEGPLCESSRTDGATRKGRLRKRLADLLFEADATGRVKATSGRASDFFGPGASNTIAGQLVFPAVLKGKQAHWIGSLDAEHSMSYIDDVARGLILLGDDPKAVGRVWHLPAPPPVTGREFIRTAFEVAGREPKIGVYPRWMLRLVGLFNRQMREIVEVLYQFEEPFVLDHSKFATTFPSFRVTSIREGIERSLAAERM